MMSLGGDAWVRKDMMVAGDPRGPRGMTHSPNTPLVTNGVIGDPRPSIPEIGTRYLELKVANAVAQIRVLAADATR